jgi:hypothetical protein
MHTEGLHPMRARFKREVRFTGQQIFHCMADSTTVPDVFEETLSRGKSAEDPVLDITIVHREASYCSNLKF